MASTKLEVEKWDTKVDGPLSVLNMKKKLERQGYSSVEYTFSPGTVFPDHTHSYTKKDSIVSGRFRFGMHRQEVILEPGDMMVVPANTVHNAAVVGNDPVIFFDASKGSC